MHRVRLLRAPTQVCQFGHRGVQEEPVPDLLGRPQQRLHVPFELPHGLAMPLRRIEPAPEIDRHVLCFVRVPFRTEAFEELAQGLHRAGTNRLAVVPDDQCRTRRSGQLRNPPKFSLYAFGLGRLPVALVIRDGDHGTVFDHQVPGQHQGRNFRIAEPPQQAPDVAIDWFRPDALAGVEVTADQHRIDARIEGGRVKGDQAAFRMASHADRHRVAVLLLEPVDGGQYLLHLVADDVPAHVKSLPVDPLPPSLPRVLDLLIRRVQWTALHEHRNDHFAALFGQTPRELVGGFDSRRQPKQLFRGLIRVGQGDHASGGWLLGLDQQSLRKNTFQDGPTNLIDTVPGGLRDQCRLEVVAVAFHPRCGPWIDRADDLSKPLAVLGDRRFVSLARTRVDFPVLAPSARRFGDLALDKLVCSVHQPRGKILFGPVECLGARQQVRRGRIRRCQGSDRTDNQAHQPDATDDSSIHF